MRHAIATIAGITVLGVFLTANAFAQEAGDYRAAATGDWSAAATWETYDGASWTAATDAPTGAETIAISGENTVSVDVAVSASDTVNVSETGVLTVTDGSLEFAATGVYQHDRDGGSVPEAVWAEGSTALFTGITTDAPDDRGQDYHHLTLDTPGLLSNQDLSLDGNTIGGDLTVASSGSARWRLLGGDSGEITIMGDVVVMEDASLETQGTGSATEVVVHHYGDVAVTGGNFSVSRGSQGSGTGTTTWFIYDGDFSMSNGESQNSNPTPGNAKFVFAGSGVHTLTLGEGNDIDDLSIEVADSSTLDLGVSELDGGGIFRLQDGATVASAHVNGLEGNLLTTGDVSLGTNLGFTYNGTEAQVGGALLPDTLGTLTVSNSAGLTLSDTNYVAVLQVDDGALLTVDSTGVLTAAEGSVDGTVVNEGELTAESALAFGASAVYEHARNGGDVPDGEWSAGSTIEFTGVVDDAPGNRGQDYHHVVLNTPGQTSNLHLSLSDATVGGDIRVVDTGLARWYLASASPEDTATVTLMGDVIVEDGQFAVQGTGNALTTFVVHHHGDVIVTGGNFSIARGSQGGAGTTTWYLHEGDFSMSGARTQNSNKGNAKFVFTADGIQQIVLGDDNDVDNLPIEVEGGTTLSVGMSELTGDDLFTLNEGATLATQHEEGVAGAIQTSGDVTFDTGASFAFSGSTPQVTSTLMPATVNDLSIYNAAGVTLSQATTIEGVLTLGSGAFDNTIPFTLGPEATISVEGGSLVVPVSTEEVAEVPAEFALHQNYPNPFNPSTTIRYDIRDRAHVTVRLYDAMGREVAELVDKDHAAGSYRLEWDASDQASGVYYYQIRAGDWSATKSLLLVK